MKLSVKSIFDDECKHLVINAELVKKIRNYQMNFVLKNPDHQAFFGGNTTGVQVVRFLPSDRDKWFDEILEVDEDPLGDLLLQLPTIDHDWFIIGSDTMNLSCLWLAHAVYISTKLTDKQKHEAMIDIFLILQYKYLTSILYNSFRYPADKAVAEATYASLSGKFGLKQYGSWTALLVARSEAIIDKKGIHFDVISKFNNDEHIRSTLNDIQGRIRDIIKNIYRVYVQVLQQGSKISTISSISVDKEGEEIIRDKTKAVADYVRYTKSIVSDKNSFVHAELTSVIEKMIHTMPPHLLQQTLDWISINYSYAKSSDIEEVLENTILHCFDYISHNKDVVRNHHDIANLLTVMKGVYMSSRSTDPLLLSIREKTENIVKIATGSRNTSVIASVRTGTMLYIVLRALAKKHYE